MYILCRYLDVSKEAVQEVRICRCLRYLRGERVGYRGVGDSGARGLVLVTGDKVVERRSKSVVLGDDNYAFCLRLGGGRCGGLCGGVYMCFMRGVKAVRFVGG